jgi:hypothetical protein
MMCMCGILYFKDGKSSGSAPRPFSLRICLFESDRREFRHSTVTEPDAVRLVELKFIYRLFGALRITHAGRARIISGR